MDAQTKEVVSTLRSCLITSKNGCPIDNLNRDYKMLEGRNIPYQKLGFQTLDAFLKIVPGIRMIRKGVDWWVEAIPTKESAHIARLVANQNQPKSRRRKPQRFMRPTLPRRPQSVPLYRLRSTNTPSQNNRGPSFSNPTTPTTPAKVTVYPPKPLMQQIIMPPLMSVPPVSPPKPRYTAANAAAMTSPSKRMLDRNIQPQQHLDYEKKHRASVAGRQVTVYSPKKSPPLEPLSMPMRPHQPAGTTPPIAMTPVNLISPINLMTPVSPSTPMTPVSSGPMGLWSSVATRQNPAGPGPATHEPSTPVQPSISGQPVAKSKICDRLKIQPSSTIQFDNFTVTNGNGSIQVTFNNTTNGGSDCPTDPREELKIFVQSLNLPPPEYKDVPVQGRKGTEGRIYGQVLIGSQKFSSYPEEAKTKTDAEILAARRALLELKKEVAPKHCLSSTTDKRLMKQRILKIIDQHNGVFTHKIPAFYEELYNEHLPENWKKEIDKWTEITMENGVNNSTILSRRVTSTADTDKAPGQSSQKTDKEVLLKPIGLVKPAPLELPKEHEWIAYVSLVNNWDEIWVRPVGETYSDEFDKMTISMIKHYESTKYPSCDVVEVGEYYALPEGEYCNRVRVLDYDKTTAEAMIFFVDSGDEDTVPANKLLPLEKKFCLLSEQAIKVSLDGLEEFADCPDALDLPRIEKLLLDGVFYVVDESRDMEDGRPVASVVFYDTNGADDVNVNEIIKEKIIQKLVTTVPKLKDHQAITEINISNVDSNGDLFIQVKHESMKYLVNMLNKLISTGLTQEDIKRSVVQSVDRTTVYFVKCSESGNWFRARVLDTMSGTTPLLKVFLIDFGKTINVSPANVLQLEILSKVLTKIPAQAMKVRLHDIESSMLDEKMITRLTELAPPSQTLLLKVVSRDSIPTVNLYKRNESDNALIFINIALTLEYELSKANGDGNNNVNKPRKRIERVNSRTNGEPDDVTKPLKPPKIPEIGKYFEIHVTMAANPSNFTVQPLANCKQLEAMMFELQEVCLANTGPHPSLESIREGRVYAAQHVDASWYRVCVSNIINEHMVTVYFCDFGDVTVITLDKLKPLAKQFYELPYQAIKAKLVDIQPSNIDWSPEDCVRFHELVVERNFVSIVTELVPDEHSPGDTVLGLKLIDTSTPDDIYIDGLLVDEGRATYTN